MVCDRVLPFLTKMVIDEDKRYILTNYQAVRQKGKAIDSDHNTQYVDFDLRIESIKPERQEIFDFKNEEGQKTFKRLTSETNEFSKCFETDAPLLEQIEKWQKVLKSSFRKSFKKIRIKKKKFIPMRKEILKLIDERNKILKCQDPESKINLDLLNKRISSLEAEDNRNKLKQNFQYFSDNPENINMSQMWKLLKKLCPKFGRSLPTAKRNHRGKIVSGEREIKILLAKEYKERLRSRPIRPDMKSMEYRKKIIFQMKMKIAQSKKSPDWTMQNLEDVLSKLKNNKCRDYDGLINEIFKLNVIGEDLKKSLLVMCNQLRKEGLIPKLMNIANITTVPKKGSRLILKNERGIFRVSVIRYILMSLIYDSKYPGIDRKMSDCQMGGRRGKGCKNNIFIVNGIIHEVLQSRKMKPVVLQFYDYSQMFDSINLQEAISDIFDTGVDDDNLVLLYNANKEIDMAVKTANGLSDRKTVNEIVLQGDKWGSILASVQVDKIGQDCMNAGYFYSYKNVLPVGFLGLVDDTVGITEAGYKAHQLNAVMNVKTAEKTLQFGVSKCKSMIVGKNLDCVVDNPLQVDNWTVEYQDNRKTGEADLVEYYGGKVDIGKVEEYTYLGFVVSSKGDNLVNIRQLEKKSIGVIRKIYNKLGSMNLQQYYFEGAVILMNTMLRGSILYACEMYYNMKEIEIRRIERIEEGFMRKILQTTKGCPITQLYLTIGQAPARFEIQKMRLLYLKYILDQDEDSTLKKFLNLQFKHPVRGDWASTVMNDIEEFEITLSLEEIKNLTKLQFTKILKTKLKENAFRYLMQKRGKKGSEICYTKLEMAEYLLPYNASLTIEQKCELFAVKNRMTQIPYNFPKSKEKHECWCGEIEDMDHIYNCELYTNNKKQSISYNNIHNGKLEEQLEVFRNFKQNLDQRERMKAKIEPPCDLSIRCKQ